MLDKQPPAAQPCPRRGLHGSDYFRAGEKGLGEKVVQRAQLTSVLEPPRCIAHAQPAISARHAEKSSVLSGPSLRGLLVVAGGLGGSRRKSRCVSISGQGWRSPDQPKEQSQLAETLKPEVCVWKVPSRALPGLAPGAPRFPAQLPPSTRRLWLSPCAHRLSF